MMCVVARINSLSEVFELRYTSLGVGQDISSRIEHVIASDLPRDTPVLTFMRCKV